MNRTSRFAAALASCLVALPLASSPEAQAQARQPAKPAAAPAGQGNALELGTFGEWVAYSSQSGRTKVCYVLTKPKERLPRTLTRDPGFLFITSRPGEQVRNEVSFVLGFAARESTPGEASIGNANFALA
ncbi:MAG: hypothetical protein NTW00_01140, partial [Hyphomicrobiales bacterium]|nr:hypothetical protein [Hyphomicrobiales bacterium]